MSDVKFVSVMGVKLINEPLPEKYIVEAARTSTGVGFGVEEPEMNARDIGLLKRLLRDGHMTPFEYPDLIFKLDIPLFVHNQLVKHRISTINTQSGRYREFEPMFYLPHDDRYIFQRGKAMDYDFVSDSEVEQGDDVRSVLLSSIIQQNEDWYREYQHRLKEGVAREVARFDMPLNTYTSCWVKMNLRSWLNFIELRTFDPDAGFFSHAQKEINMVADEIAAALCVYYPNVMEEFYSIHREKRIEGV